MSSIPCLRPLIGLIFSEGIVSGVYIFKPMLDGSMPEVRYVIFASSPMIVVITFLFMKGLTKTKQMGSRQFRKLCQAKAARKRRGFPKSCSIVTISSNINVKCGTEVHYCYHERPSNSDLQIDIL